MKITEPELRCFDCNSAEFHILPKIIPSGKPFPYPKYIPQLKEVCANCGRWLRFAPQDEKTINALNERLESLLADQKGLFDKH